MLIPRRDIKIDERDRQILSLLLENGRIPLKEIGKRLGISDVAVKKRIDKLEKAGIIRGYTANIDPKALGFSIISLTGVDVEPGDLIRLARILSSKE